MERGVSGKGGQSDNCTETMIPIVSVQLSD